MISQRIGRLPMGIIGLGIRWVSSPMRTPSPPQKMTTFIAPPPPRVAVPGSNVVAVGIGTTSLAPHSAVYASCSLISRARFHGSTTITSGFVSAIFSGGWIGMCVPGVCLPCLYGFRSTV